MFDFSSYALSIIQLLLIIAIIYFEYSRKSASVFLWAMLFLLFGIMHCKTVFTRANEFPVWVYDSASVFVICFCVIYLLTRIVFCPVYTIRLPKFTEENNLTDGNKRFLNITIIILSLTVAYRVYAVASFSGGLLNTSWSMGRDASASKDYFSEDQVIICLYNYACSAILLSIFYKKRIQAIYCILLVFFCAIITRNRIVFLPILVSIIAYYLYNGTRLSLKKILILLGIGAFSILVIYALQIFRYYGNFIQLYEQFDINDFDSKILTNISNDKGDIGLREVFYYFIYNNNNFENFGKGHSYIRLFLVFLPTSYSGGLKPPDFAISMGTAMNTGIKGFSTHPTLFGDCYANFGYYGVFLGIFWAGFMQIFDFLINKQKRLEIKLCLIMLCGNAYIIIGRGSVYNAYIWMIYGIILMFISRYFAHSCKRKNIRI